MRQPVRWLVLALVCGIARAGEYPRQMTIYRGTTPTIDGVISPGEYDDAITFTGVQDWIPQFTPTTSDDDLSLVGWAKHDGEDLFFAFSITDDLLYGIDTDRWLPPQNPHAHELSRRGFPWFGDEMELLINARYEWSQEDGQNCAGDGTSWQMVCNLTKSRLHGIGHGGLIEGEPRSKLDAWRNYQNWILTGAQVAAAKVKPGGGGYVIEWQVKPNPCLEVKPGVFWSPSLGQVKMGLNIALGDLDTPDAGSGNWGYFHHEDWWAGEKNKRTWLKQWGTLIIEPGNRPARSAWLPDLWRAAWR